jgi:hypothetical protein
MANNGGQKGHLGAGDLQSEGLKASVWAASQHPKRAAQLRVCGPQCVRLPAGEPRAVRVLLDDRMRRNDGESP